MKKKLLLLLVVTIFTSSNYLSAQITFQKCFGGQRGKSVQQTTDGGYIITGIGSGAGVGDIYLIKTDANGDSLWTKTFGEFLSEYAFSVQQTSDGGYIVGGITNSFGSGVSDVYLIKTDANGDSLWTRTYGGTGDDEGFSVQQTTDGGYIISGATSSFGAGDDVYLIKTDGGGNLLWTKTYSGTPGSNQKNSVLQIDGGYIIAGSIYGIGAGAKDVDLIKTDINGNALWIKTFGGIANDYGTSVQQTTDGGYIIAGSSNLSSIPASADVYLIKTDANGDTLWTKTFGGTASDLGNSVQQTVDGGYIIGGSTSSFGGSSNLYLIKTDLNGNLLWSKTFGGTGWDDDGFAKQTADGGYIITGYLSSFSIYGVYLIKTDSLGNSGCNVGNPATIVTSHSSQVTNPVTIATSTATIVTTPATIVGSGGTVTTLCTTVGIPSAIPNLPSAITISPNPATNNFTITFPNTINKGVIEIYNLMGEKIFSENIVSVSQKEIHLKNIEAGIYFVKVKDGEKDYCEKMVIE